MCRINLGGINRVLLYHNDFLMSIWLNQKIERFWSLHTVFKFINFFWEFFRCFSFFHQSQFWTWLGITYNSGENAKVKLGWTKAISTSMQWMSYVCISFRSTTHCPAMITWTAVQLHTTLPGVYKCAPITVGTTRSTNI